MTRFSYVLIFLSAFCLSWPAMAQSDMKDRLLRASFTTINTDAALTALTDELAQQAITEHCAACHGPDLTGKEGVPDLTDFDWLWGITLSETTTTEPVFEIMQTVLYGIRDTNCPEESKSYGACPDTRYSEMPAYRQLELNDSQLNDLVEYVYFLAGRQADTTAVERAGEHAKLCTECHGEDGFGYKPYGGPDLTDDVWLYGDTRETIFETVANGRLGYCPPYWDKLDMATIKALAVYIYRGFMGY